MGNEELALKKDYVLASHERCKKYNIETDQVFSNRIIKDHELFNKLESKRELIITAEPFMNQLYSFVKGSHFFAILTDDEGCILSVFGDEEILTEAFSLKMIPGAYMDEKNIGTNAMGTSLFEGKPVQISGTEHYVKVYHRWTCSAAPIRNSEGRIIGSLDLTGYCENVHSHTLGMVVAASNAIEKMIEIKKYTEELYLAKIYTETIIDSITAGILTTDMDGNIVTINHHVAGMFGFKESEIKEMKIWSLFEGWEHVKTAAFDKLNIVDEDVFVNARKNKLQLNLSTYPIIDKEKNVRNIIFVFKELKKVRKLANKIMGRQAIYTFDKIIGKNERFLQVISYSKKIADSRSNILIMGESGTGKELFAQAIHNYSSRCGEFFVALNCGAIPRDLIESELFGYEDGAFTGAKSGGHTGKFEIADGGTIFLDEIGEMPLDMQTRLLRVIEEGTVSRIGGVKEIVVDVRIIAATNKDLDEEVRKGNFRKDLFYRLNVLPIRLPALRERRDDILLLINYYMERVSRKLNKRNVKIPEDYLNYLCEYEWPGNIRELENLAELIVNTEAIPYRLVKAVSVLDEKLIANPVTVEQNQVPDKSLNLEDMEKQHIMKVLRLYNGNITLSARALVVGRNTLYRRMKYYGIDCSEMNQCSNM